MTLVAQENAAITPKGEYIETGKGFLGKALTLSVPGYTPDIRDGNSAQLRIYVLMFIKSI